MFIYRGLAQTGNQANHGYATYSETNLGHIMDINNADPPLYPEQGAPPQVPKKLPCARQALGYDGGLVDQESLSSSIEISGSEVQSSAGIIPPASQQMSATGHYENDIQTTGFINGSPYDSYPIDVSQHLEDSTISESAVIQGYIVQGTSYIAEDHRDAEEYFNQNMVHGCESNQTETPSTVTIKVHGPMESQYESDDSLYDIPDTAGSSATVTVEASLTTTTEQLLVSKVSICQDEYGDMADRLTHNQRNSEQSYPSENQTMSEPETYGENYNSIHHINRPDKLDSSQTVSQQHFSVAYQSHIPTSDSPKSLRISSSSDGLPPYSTLPGTVHDGASDTKTNQLMETQHCRISQNQTTAKNDSTKEPYSEGENIASTKTPVPLSPLSNDATLITASITTSPYSPSRPNIISLGMGLSRCVSEVLVSDDSSNEEDEID